MTMVRSFLCLALGSILILAAVADAKPIPRKIAKSRYFASSEITVAPGSCDCVYSVCDVGDIVFTCGGRAELETPEVPRNAFLNSVLSVELAETGDEACEVCGCNTDSVAGLTFVSQAACLDL